MYGGRRETDVALGSKHAFEAGEVVLVLADGDMAVEWLLVVLRGDECGKEREEDSARDRVSVKRRHGERSQLYALRHEARK